MATATAYTPFNSDTFNIWYGTATVATSTQIQITSGNQIQNYYGYNFTFSSSGQLTGGFVTGTNYYLSGTLQYEVTGLNHSATTVNSYLNANNPQGLLAFLFNGSDTAVGSSGN